MTEKKVPTNKAAAVRDYSARHPTAKPRAVADALSEQGIKVPRPMFQRQRARQRSANAQLGSAPARNPARRGRRNASAHIRNTRSKKSWSSPRQFATRTTATPGRVTKSQRRRSVLARAITAFSTPPPLPATTVSRLEVAIPKKSN